MIKVLRINQWSKNLLIFVVMFAANSINFTNVSILSILFFSFSLIVSSTYIFNDLVDIQSDLNNLDRPLTKNIFQEYTPFNEKAFQEPIYGKGDYFEQNNSRLSDPAFDLKEFGINQCCPVNFNINVPLRI